MLSAAGSDRGVLDDRVYAPADSAGLFYSCARGHVSRVVAIAKRDGLAFQKERAAAQDNERALVHVQPECYLGRGADGGDCSYLFLRALSLFECLSVEAGQAERPVPAIACSANKQPDVRFGPYERTATLLRSPCQDFKVFAFRIYGRDVFEAYRVTGEGRRCTRSPLPIWLNFTLPCEKPADRTLAMGRPAPRRDQQMTERASCPLGHLRIRTSRQLIAHHTSICHRRYPVERGRGHVRKSPSPPSRKWCQ
jgi:hypothetical protein